MKLLRVLPRLTKRRTRVMVLRKERLGVPARRRKEKGIEIAGAAETAR